ncbi:MAG: hypothetical protein IJQ39_08830 [Thermoguttaceae bacterium]|nr:hypothetical protein [Thermoguttaceae bacterium]
MFSISLAAVTILTAFGAIAVLWAQSLYAASRSADGSCRKTLSGSWLSKITSQSEKKPPLSVRERLLRLMMIFERAVVNRFSFTKLSSFMTYSCHKGCAQSSTRVSLLTAYLYHFGSRSGGSPVLKTILALICTARGVFSPGKKRLSLAVEPVRVRDKRYRQI